MADQDIYATLIEQHRETSDLMQKLEKTSTDDKKTRQDLFLELYTALGSHTVAESRTLYDRLAQFNEMADTIRDDEQEHDEVNRLLEELREMEPDDEQWMDTLETLQKNVEHHVSEEENELFPKARQLLDAQEAENLQGRFEQEQEKVKRNMR